MKDHLVEKSSEASVIIINVNGLKLPDKKINCQIVQEREKER